MALNPPPVQSVQRTQHHNVIAGLVVRRANSPFYNSYRQRVWSAEVSLGVGETANQYGFNENAEGVIRV